MVCADELLACPGVNSVEARPGVFGAGDEHMHLLGAGITQKADNLSGGGSADYGIVNQGYGFAFDHAADGGHLHPDAQVSHRLGRLDECPGHVDVLQQGLPIGMMMYLVDEKVRSTVRVVVVHKVNQAV